MFIENILTILVKKKLIKKIWIFQESLLQKDKQSRIRF
jgi:hypothetical protein